MSWSFGGTGGGPASSNLRNRVCAAWYGRRPVVVRGLLLVHQHQLAQLLVLLVPAPAQLVEAGVPGPEPRANWRSRRGAPRRCHPRRRPPGRRSGPAARGRARRRAPASSTRAVAPPASACRARRGSCPVRRAAAPRPAAQQQLQGEALLLAAGEGTHRTVPYGVPRLAEHDGRDGVEEHLGVVPAGLAPGGERIGVRQLGLARGVAELAVGLGRPHGRLGLAEPPAGIAKRRRGQRQRQVGEGRLVTDHADELAHHTQPAGPRDDAAAHRQVAGDHPQQRRLSRAVRPDQGDLGALPDPERHVGEEFPTVGQDVPDRCHVHVSHAGILPERGGTSNYRVTRSTRKPFWLAYRSTCQLCSVSQRCRESPPRCRATTNQPTPSGASRGSQRSNRSCSPSLPIRMGGFDQIWPKRTPSGTSSGALTRTRSGSRPEPRWRRSARGPGR